MIESSLTFKAELEAFANGSGSEEEIRFVEARLKARAPLSAGMRIVAAVINI